MAFNPDKFLAETATKKATFDPDKFLSETSEVYDDSVMGSIKATGRDALEFAGDTVEAIDAYSGAGATRKALKTFGETGSVGDSISAFSDQYGETEGAPSGAEVAKSLGVKDVDTLSGAYAQGTTPEEIQQSLREMPEEEQLEKANVPLESAVGVGIDVMADPLMVLPVAKILKGTTKGVVGATKATGRVAKDTGHVVLSSSKLGQKALKGAEVGADIVKRTSSAMGKNLKSMFNPIQVEDYPRLRKILDDNNLIPKNIDDIPEALEFGERSSISTGSKVLRQGPTGEARAKIFDDFLSNVDGAVENKITSMADEVGGDAFRGGEQLLEGYNKSVKELFDGAEVTYQNFNAIAPDHALSSESMQKIAKKLERIDKRAKHLTKTGVGKDRAKAKALLADIQAIKNGIGNGDYQSFVDSMQSVGRGAFSKKKEMLEIVPVDRKKLQDIYYTMRDIVQNEVTKFDPNLGAKLKESNMNFNKFFSDNDGISKILGRSKDPAVIFNSLIKNGNITNLRALKETIPAEAFDRIRATYLKSLIDIDPTYGGISYKKTINKLQANKRKLTEMFEGEEELLKQVEDLLEVGRRSGDRIANYSGTDVSKQFREFMTNLLNISKSEATMEASKASARTRRAEKLAKGQKKSPKKTDSVTKSLKEINSLGRKVGRKYPETVGTQRGLKSILSEPEDDSKQRKKNGRR